MVTNMNLPITFLDGHQLEVKLEMVKIIIEDGVTQELLNLMQIEIQPMLQAYNYSLVSMRSALIGQQDKVKD